MYLECKNFAKTKKMRRRRGCHVLEVQVREDKKMEFEKKV